MTNHPNRSRRADAPGRAPTPDEVKIAREAAGLTQVEAARLIYVTERAWQRYEAGERQMPAGYWELFLLKI